VWDTFRSNLGVRVTDKGARTFVVVRRLPGRRDPETVVLGGYDRAAGKKPSLTLAEAREAAELTLAVLDRGQRPKELEEANRREEAKRRRDTFGAVAEAYITDHVAGLRHAIEMEQIIRREFLGQRFVNGQWVSDPVKHDHWRQTPIKDIARGEVVALIRTIKSRGKVAEGSRRRTTGGPWAAHHALAAVRALFAWAIEQEVYGLDVSPCALIRPAKLIGAKEARSRTLDDGELFVVWRAARKIGHPYGTLVKLLLLTGARLNEVAGARWQEIDLDRGLLTVPAGRMKMRTTHVIPLSPAASALLGTTPRFKGGDYPISTTAGQRQFSGFSKAKVRLDREIERTRVALARLAQRRGGEPPIPEPVPPFTLHDLRRTVRTRLSALGVLPTVAELVIGHAQPGLHKVYDLHTFDAEKADALRRWEQHLLRIVQPASMSVSRSTLADPSLGAETPTATLTAK